MKSKIHTYENSDIRVTYDSARCIHAAECVRGLREVFDPEKRPWIQPGQAAASNVADIIELCPTGALHYELKDSERTEQKPEQNTIQFQEDGPIYIRGDIRVEDAQGNLVLED